MAARARPAPIPPTPSSMPWPATSVEMRPLAELRPYERNARQHPPEQIEQIAASMLEFGFTIPVLVDETGLLIAGHGRVLAARKLVDEGRAEFKRVPVMVATGWTDAQRRAYTIADNRLGETSTWDLELLRLELGELRALDFDLPTIGFDDVALTELFAPPPNKGRVDPDDVPEPPAEPISQPGDVWLLGEHRLVCGDSTDRDHVARAVNGELADLVFTSPPYAVNVDYGDTYQDTIHSLRSMLPKQSSLWFSLVRPGGFAVVNFGDIVTGSDIAGVDEPCEYPMAVEYWPVFRGAGWLLFTRRVWQKPHARVSSPWAIQSCRAASDWEHIWTWKKPGRPIVGRGTVSAFGVWDTSTEPGVDIGKSVHGAGMAVGLAKRAIETHSRRGRLVFEPFCGTGTTLITCEMTGRRCAAVEINPAFTDVAVRRWENFTGKIAARQRLSA
jgi:hypothetical protein